MISCTLNINFRINDFSYIDGSKQFIQYDIFELPKISTDCLNDPSADNDMFLND